MEEIKEGVLSGWREIEADIRTNLHEEFGESKDVQDILDLIHHLKVLANSDNPLRLAFEQHVTSNENPHNFELNIHEIDLFNVMYNEYITRFGITMTLAEFITAIISIKRFATRDDVDNETNLNSTVNLDILNYAIAEHNVDPEAHYDLLRMKFPGEPISVPPTVAIIPNVITEHTLSVERASVMNYHDVDGRVKELPIDTIAADYLYGIPALPIFSETTNHLLESEAGTNVSLHGAGRLPTSNITLYTPKDNMNYLLLGEDGTDDNHGVIVPTPTTTVNGLHTFSVYIFPFLRTKFTMSLFDGTTFIGIGTFDLNAVESLTDITNGVAHTEILPLPSGWIRCSITFKVDRLIPSIHIKMLDINDADSFLGQAATSMAMWQFQLVDKPSSAPPIITTAAPESIASTFLTKPITDEYHELSGSVHMRAITPLAELYDNIYELFCMTNDLDQHIIHAGNGKVNRNVLNITTYGKDDDVLTTIDSHEYSAIDPRLAKHLAFSYTYGHQSYGFTDNIPHVFDYYAFTLNGSDVILRDETNEYMMRFFDTMYDANPGESTGVVFLQLNESDIVPVDSPLPLTRYPNDTDDVYMMNESCDRIEIGHNSETGYFLEGYLLEFGYYPVFSDPMNIEFLINQYVLLDSDEA